jgi:glutaredoxin 3
MSSHPPPSAPSVVVYTTDYCPYCFAAKRLLTARNIAFTEIDVSRDPNARDALVRKSGGRTTVPQIWIGSVHVGGCDDLHALDRAGKLPALLAQAHAQGTNAPQVRSL